MTKVYGQWTMNSLLLEFRPELECFRLIDGDDAHIFRSIWKIKHAN